MYNRDTICAIATPYGEGGIAVIRVSGDESFNITEKIFKGNVNFKNNEFEANKIYYGKIIDFSGNELDEVLLSIFKEPHSFSGENTVEINCHGGRLITKKIIDVLLKIGCRLAEAGEFTKRAFLNGRIDLSQAEAISDLIAAKNDFSLRYSLNMLSGNFGGSLKNIQKEILELCSLIELELDFVEDDLEFIERKNLSEKVQKLHSEISKMVESFNVGKMYKDGIKVTLVGKPNVGKSTLLNSLLNSDRAIVSNIPGTTRDFIEENIYLNGFLFRLVDTAGLRITENEIEKNGIERTFDQAKESDIIIYIFDISQEFSSDDWDYFKKIEILTLENKELRKLLIVFNKMDLLDENSVDDFIGKKMELKNSVKVTVSNKDQKSYLNLQKELIGIINKFDENIDNNKIITNIRHRNALLDSKNNLEKAMNSIKNNESGEFISVSFRKALNSIGEIIGTVSSEDILNNIFSKFCIGK